MPRFGELTIQKIPFTHLIHFTLAAGAVNVLLGHIIAGCLLLPYRIHRLSASIDPPCGGLNTLTIVLSNGVDDMTLNITGAETTATDEDGFDVDPATQDLSLHYTNPAASAANKVIITICRHYT